MKHSIGLSLVAAVAVSACVDRGLEPLAPETEGIESMGSAAASLLAPEAGYVVEFSGNGPADLAARVAELGGRVDFTAPITGFAVISGVTPESAAALSATEGVARVFPDAAVFLDAEPTMGDVDMIASQPGSIANPAGGFRHSYQWNLRQIGAHVAWAAGHLGSPDVSIAILDTGIDYDSYDMAGMVDLDRSASFVPNDNAILAFYRPGRHVIDDMNGHGTNVATQASSNATIFAGVNSRARLIGIKVLGYNGSGSLGGIIAGLEHAANVGADVANMSLGVRFGVDKSAVPGFTSLVNRVFNYANRKGMVVVVSAGNEALDMDNTGNIFFAYCEAPHVVCVAATGPTSSTNSFSGPWNEPDSPASYTNFGRKDITVAAPGGTNRGWVSAVCARGRITAVSGGQPVFGCNVPPGFFVTTGYAGTSQAAPHVAGVVAQLIAKHGKNNPAQLRHALVKDAVDDLGPRGRDAFYGHGRVNLAKALGL